MKAADDTQQEPAIDLVFGEGGLLSQHFDGYRPRPGQIALARAVEDALFMGEDLIGEAGTGVGKSFAYAVPLIAHCAATGGRGVIATANIALQEQLVNKDLPFLKEILPWDFDFAMRKGKGNYLCESAHSSFLMHQQGDLFGGGRAVEEGSEMRRILEWAETTETGDKTELPFVPSRQAWSRVSVGPDDCKGKRCRYYKNCHAVRAAGKAAAAQIVVVNHHLLFANIKYAGAVLAPHDAVIIDEAHEAVGIARDFLGFRVGEGLFKRLAGRMRTFGLDEQAKELADAGSVFFRDINMYRSSPAYGIRLMEPDCVKYKHVLGALQRAHDGLEHCARSASTEDAAAAIDIERDRALGARECIRTAMALEDPNMVIHIGNNDDGDRAWIEGRPLDVSRILRPTLFADTPSVIMTSATLTIDGSFDHAIEAIGADSPEQIEVESPFDPKNRILIVPNGMPDTKDFPRWHEYVCEMVASIIQMANGRTLALFTSTAMLRRAAEHMELAIPEHRVLVQNEMPRSTLIQEFRNDISSSLLGTRSFWAGVDVPGESCSVVVIDKMPFNSPKDPIEHAFEEKFGRRMFGKRMLPEAVIQFKQGAGRLIRSMEDRGALVMLDRRIVEKGYGAKFINSLGSIDVSRDIEDVGRMLSGQATEDYYGEEVPF